MWSHWTAVWSDDGPTWESQHQSLVQRLGLILMTTTQQCPRRPPATNRGPWPGLSLWFVDWDLRLACWLLEIDTHTHAGTRTHIHPHATQVQTKLMILITITCWEHKHTLRVLINYYTHTYTHNQAKLISTLIHFFSTRLWSVCVCWGACATGCWLSLHTSHRNNTHMQDTTVRGGANHFVPQLATFY